jgi:hypothetical protein
MTSLDDTAAPRPGRRPWRADAIGLALTAVLMVLSWLLVHGLTRGLYDSYEALGEPAIAGAPTGGTGRVQLGPWGYFWSERAFHYRTTLMFAVDDYTSPGVLSADTAQQHPDGVDAWREYTLLMEPVYGWLYRVFGGEREVLAEFLTRLIPLIHVLLLPLLYALARGLGARPLVAAAAPLIHATCTLGFERLAGSLLLKETFTLAWLLAFAAAAVWAQRRRSTVLLTAAAGALVVVLASWHLGQFLALVLLGALALAAVREPAGDAPAGGEEANGGAGTERSGWWPLPWAVRLPAVLLAAALLAGLTPSLLARGFWLSPPVAVLVAWTALAAVRWRRPGWLAGPGRATAALVVLVALLGAASLLNRALTGDYGHVFGLLVGKLAHGFARPDDPAPLPFDVRVFWAAPFLSPSWADVRSGLGWHAVTLGLGLVGGVLLWARGRLTAPQQALVLTCLALTAAWLLIERLGVVWLPFAVVLLVVVAGRAATTATATAGRGIPGRAAIVLAVVLAVVLLAAPLANLAGPFGGHVGTAAAALRGEPVMTGAASDPRNLLRADLLRWLRTATPGPGSDLPGRTPGAVVGDIDASPAILLAAGRPTVLNSQFENAPIRRRYERYLAALFDPDPGRLRAFLAEVDARYLVLNRNWATTSGPGTAAYLAGVQGPPRLERTVARLHFAPTSLGFLHPVWDNEMYRVFRVGRPPVEGPLAWQTRHSGWWDLASWTAAGDVLADPAADRARLRRREEAVVALQQAQEAILARLESRTPRGQPPLRALHQRLAELRWQALSGADEADTTGAAARDRQIASVGDEIARRLGAPLGQGRGTYGEALTMLWQRGLRTGESGWREIVGADDAEPAHLGAAADLLALVGRYGEAARLFERAAAAYPLAPLLRGDGRVEQTAPLLARQARQSAVWFHLAAADTGAARNLATRYAPHAAPGSPGAAFLAEVASLATAPVGR